MSEELSKPKIGGRRKSNCKPLKCLENGKEFESIREALLWLGAVSQNALVKAIKCDRPFRGFTFVKLPRVPSKPKPVRGNRSKCGRKRKHFDVSPEAKKERMRGYMRDYKARQELLNSKPLEIPRVLVEKVPLLVRCGKCQALVTKGCEQVNCKFIQSKRRCKI